MASRSSHGDNYDFGLQQAAAARSMDAKTEINDQTSVDWKGRRPSKSPLSDSDYSPRTVRFALSKRPTEMLSGPDFEKPSRSAAQKLEADLKLVKTTLTMSYHMLTF